LDRTGSMQTGVSLPRFINVTCLSGRDLSEYEYISVSRDGIVLVNVKPMNMTRLSNIGGK
jgi:hypothetical protein